MSDELKVQPALALPRELGKMIVPTFEVNPRPQMQFIEGIAGDAVSATIMTTHSTKRTFLIATSLSVSKDIVSDSVRSYIAVTAKGKTGSIFSQIRYEPLTAGSHLLQFVLPLPIELEPNTIIEIVNTSGTASIDAAGVIYFYETDPQ